MGINVSQFFDKYSAKYDEFKNLHEIDADFNRFHALDKYLEKVITPEIITYVKTLSNKQVFDLFREYIQCDDYDGCFTAVGEVLFNELNKELNIRLKPWLNE